MVVEKNKLARKERKLLAKLASWKIYKVLAWGIYKIFSYKKKFLIPKKSFAIISVTVWTLLWKKVWYIDDFIVHRKERWKWVWEKLFTKAIDKIEKEDSEYAFLVSRKDRKASHKLYKKFWFAIVSLWIWVLAYKKIKK